MRLSSITLFLFLFVLLLSSCSNSCNDECRQRYWDGYRAGESKGYERGHDVGYNTGYRAGYSEGEDAGYTKGYLSGTKTYIDDSFLPSLGGAAILAAFIVALLSFKHFFQKSIGETVNDFMLWLYNLFLHSVLKRKVSWLKKSQLSRAEIIAKTSSLELYFHMTSLTSSMEYDSEFCIILSKIEQYLVEIQVSSQYGLNDETRQVLKSIMHTNSFSQEEKGELLDSIKMVLLSNLSKTQNLMKYEKSSYKKISNACENFLKHKRRYVFSLKIRRLLVYISVTVNVAILISLYQYIYNPSLFYSIVSDLEAITSTLFSYSGIY